MLDSSRSQGLRSPKNAVKYMQTSMDMLHQRQIAVTVHLFITCWGHWRQGAPDQEGRHLFSGLLPECL